MLFDELLHLENASEDLDLVWMPSHTAEAAIGNDIKSDQTPITKRDRNGNDHADELAKSAAATHRAPLPARHLKKTVQQIALYTTCLIGAVIHAASNYLDNTCLPHTVHKRDAQPKPPVKMKSKGPLDVSTVASTPAAPSTLPVLPRADAEAPAPHAMSAPAARISAQLHRSQTRR